VEQNDADSVVDVLTPVLGCSSVQIFGMRKLTLLNQAENSILRVASAIEAKRRLCDQSNVIAAVYRWKNGMLTPCPRIELDVCRRAVS
jgi:hypothetical protein